MPDNSRAGWAGAESAENFHTSGVHEHHFTHEEWSYNDERAYLLCECGARTPVPLGPKKV